MALEWNATKKWNHDYLFDLAGDTSVLYVQLIKKEGTLDKPWSFAIQRPQHMSGSLGQALNLIRNNKVSAVDAQHPTLVFIDDLLRGSNLRNDYEFPPLHDFMRLQKSAMAIWP